MNPTGGSSKEEHRKCGQMGPGRGEVAGGGVPVGKGCVRVFNTGDDGGEKLLEATVPQQVWTNRGYPEGPDGRTARRDTCIHALCFTVIHLEKFFLTGLMYVRAFKFLKSHS